MNSVTTIKPDSSATPAPTSPEPTDPTSGTLAKGHNPTTTPMDGVKLAPDTVTANSKPVGGYNGSDPY